MINSKQRAALRGAANGIEPIFQIGKDGISPAQLAGIDKALTARELIKITVLETSPLTPREAAGAVCEALSAEPVQVIGGKLVVYRRNPDIDRFGI